MPHKTRIKEGSMVKRDQSGSPVKLLRYDNVRGETIPILQFPRKELANGEVKPPATWSCKSRKPNVTPMEHFRAHYSVID